MFAAAAQDAAVGHDEGPFDADLHAVIDAWPTLADDVKARILAMAQPR